MRPSIFHLAVTGLFVWGFSASSVCEAHCAQAAAGLRGGGANARGPAQALSAHGCDHGEAPESARFSPEHAPHSSDGEFACCFPGASAAAGQAMARDGRILRPPAAAPHPTYALATARWGLPIPPGAAGITSAQRYHRNPPLLI